uniref:Uncharacterized protein n=1 Tax=Pithovirus LCPAC101 TaxID=2506586 RepID=A0A481Z201_9VIRU|nr:MAG: hypothetical protein LCPAC101_00350 [Pithovirus LCPAC101]
METKVNEKMVWLRSGKSKYLFDRRNGMKINYFRSTMDEKYGKKEYIGDTLVLTIDDEYESILKYITEYIDGNNNTRIDKKDNYTLLLKFIDFIQDNGMYIYIFKNITQHHNIEEYFDIINKCILLDDFPWLNVIESFDIVPINVNGLKYTLQKYYNIFNNFIKICRCTILWDKSFYTTVFECLSEIEKGSIEYVNINNINENSKLLTIKKNHLRKYYFDGQPYIKDIYKYSIDDIIFIDDGYVSHILITINNIKYKFCGEGEYYSDVYIKLHDAYKDLSVCIGKNIINISVDGEFGCGTMVAEYKILFSDYSIFKFNIVNDDYNYYDGVLSIVQCE